MIKIKTTEIPSHAKDLFIQLYCEKKGGETDENLYNGAQSWLSLSLTKKKHFYETISTKSAVEKAQLIIQTEPYLRKKFPHKIWKHNEKSTKSEGHPNTGKSNSDHTTTDNPSVHDDTIMECDTSFVEDHYVSEKQPMTCPLEAVRSTEECVLESSQIGPKISDVQKQQQSYMSVTDEETDTADEFEDERNAGKVLKDKPVSKITNRNELQTSQQRSYMSVIDEDTDTAEERIAEKVPLVEPILPIAKSGKELFDLLKAKNGVTKTYESLTMQEKLFYGRAATFIKKDYVMKYKEYLESLSPRQLFDYYKKIFDT